MHLGFYAIHVGNHDDAINRVREAMRLNPFGRYGYVLGIALYLSGRYDEAVAAFKTVRARVSHLHAWLAASYAQKGKHDDAQQSVATFEKIVQSDMPMASERTSRDWSLFFAERFPFERPSDLDHLLDGLRKAGLLGQP
jgi:tetratricopeptide (TPR) repeat protein